MLPDSFQAPTCTVFPQKFPDHLLWSWSSLRSAKEEGYGKPDLLTNGPASASQYILQDPISDIHSS